MTQLRWAFFGTLLLLNACFAPVRTATMPGVDFSKIKSVLVLEPEFAEQRFVTDEFARQLMARGYRVRVGGPSAGSDVWLQVTVSQVIPDKKYLVPLEGVLGRQTLVLNPITEIGGRSLYPSGSGAGVQDAQILVSNATLSLSARLITPNTQELLWSGSVTYEGLDLDVAVEGSVASLFKRFPLQ
jgi:hypothetical protein